MKTCTKLLRLLANMLATLIFISAGYGQEKANPALTAVKVTVTIMHTIDKEALVFDTIRYRNESGNQYSVSTLKYFISEIHIVSGQNISYLLKDVHYIDAKADKTRSFTGEVMIPLNAVSTLRFVFGLDEKTNRSGRFPNPPENRMEWPETMGGGYHYMKLEGKILDPSEDLNFQAHTGQLNGVPRFIRVELPLDGLKAEEGNLNLRIAMDINEWWKQPNTLNLNDISGIMDNEKVQQQLMENGADIFSIVKTDITPKP